MEMLKKIVIVLALTQSCAVQAPPKKTPMPEDELSIIAKVIAADRAATELKRAAKVASLPGYQSPEQEDFYDEKALERDALSLYPVPNEKKLVEVTNKKRDEWIFNSKKFFIGYYVHNIITFIDDGQKLSSHYKRSSFRYDVATKANQYLLDIAHRVFLYIPIDLPSGIYSHDFPADFHGQPELYSRIIQDSVLRIALKKNLNAVGALTNQIKQDLLEGKKFYGARKPSDKKAINKKVQDLEVLHDEFIKLVQVKK